MNVANDAYAHVISKGHECYGLAPNASKTHFNYCCLRRNLRYKALSAAICANF